MSKWIITGALIAIVCLIMPIRDIDTAGAEPLTPEQRQAVQDAVDDYLRGAAPTPSMQVPGAPAPSGERKRLEELAVPRTPTKKYGSTMEGSGQLIYARPFVAAPKAILGGYYDFEYINKANDGTPSNFDQHRLVPFIYGDVSDRVKFAAEIEIEHGARASGGGTNIQVEFATADYMINEPVNLRAGIILLPLGKFNLLHDAPLRDLTERPIVDQRIIPVTLHQPGVGFYGTLYPTRLSQLNYEAYIVSGFTNAFGGSANPGAGGTPGLSNITNTNGIRSARSNSTAFDNNDGKAFVGRMAFSPLLGVEVGGSGFFGSYDPRSSRPLSIWAVDWTLQRGPFEVIGEAAWAYIRDNHLNQVTGASTGNPRRMAGYYIQLNYHFLPQFLTRLAPTHFRQEVSTLTGVVRWDEVNLGQDLPETEAGRLGERQRLTLGLNFRPTEDTVVKFDYQYSPKERRGSQRIHDNGFVASVATYF